MTEILNHNVREHQHSDARSSHELLQNVSTLAAIGAYSNPGMAADANVSRGLRDLLPLSGPVNYRAEDGSKRPMTLAAAKAEMTKSRRAGGITSYTPPPIDFLVNSNTSNRMHRNGLSASVMMPWSSVTATCPPLAAAPAPAVTMVKRVMKRAGDTFFGGATSPATKVAAGKVRSQLARADAAFTSLVDDYEAEKNSQEIFKFCLEQTTLE